MHSNYYYTEKMLIKTELEIESSNNCYSNGLLLILSFSLFLYLDMQIGSVLCERQTYRPSLLSGINCCILIGVCHE